MQVAAADDWEGVEAAVEVTFEPQALGDVRDVLMLESEEGGVYACSLTGSLQTATSAGSDINCKRKGLFCSIPECI